MQAKTKLRRDGIASILDPRLKDDYPPDTFFNMADLALHCTAYEKVDRPTMRVCTNTKLKCSYVVKECNLESLVSPCQCKY